MKDHLRACVSGNCGEAAADSVFQPLQGAPKMVVVRDDEISRVAKGFDGSLVHGHDVVLKAVQDVAEVVSTLSAVAQNAPGQLEVISGVDEKGKVQFAVDFLKILDEETFYYEHGCGLQDNVFGNSVGIIEYVFFTGDGTTLLDLPDVVNELFVIDGRGEIEVLDALRVGLLVFDGFVVMILADYAQFTGGEFTGEFGDEACLSGTTAARDPDGKVNGCHTTQT